MIQIIREILAYPFLVRAVISGLLISLCSALLGVSLVLKRYAMIGDGLSHVSFGALSLALVLGLAPLTFAIPLVLLASFLLLRLSDKSDIRGDSALAMISSSALAIGVIAVSWGRGMSTDICNYMFGTILATTNSDVRLTVILSLIVITLFIFFYNRLFAITFDENFARASGTSANLYNMLLAGLTSVTIVIGMRLMGALLISALIIFPGLSAMRILKSFKAVIITAAVISLFSFSLGFIASYVLQTPSGASIVVVNLIIFLICSLIGKLRPLLQRRQALKTVQNGLAIVLVLSLTLSLASCRRAPEAKGLPEMPATSAGEGEVQNYDDLIDLIENPSEAPSLRSFEVATLPRPADGEELFIDEKMYLGWVLDIYANADQYLGQKVRIHGMFQQYEQKGNTHYVVFRYGPGCCGNDGGMCGFELTLPEGQEPPALDSWIEVIGVLERYKAEDGLLYIRLKTETMTSIEAENPYTTHY